MRPSFFIVFSFIAWGECFNAGRFDSCLNYTLGGTSLFIGEKVEGHGFLNAGAGLFFDEWLAVHGRYLFLHTEKETTGVWQSAFVQVGNPSNSKPRLAIGRLRKLIGVGMPVFMRPAKETIDFYRDGVSAVRLTYDTLVSAKYEVWVGKLEMGIRPSFDIGTTVGLRVITSFAGDQAGARSWGVGILGKTEATEMTVIEFLRMQSEPDRRAGVVRDRLAIGIVGEPTVDGRSWRGELDFRFDEQHRYSVAVQDQFNFFKGEFKLSYLDLRFSEGTTTFSLELTLAHTLGNL